MKRHNIKTLAFPLLLAVLTLTTTKLSAQSYDGSRGLFDLGPDPVFAPQNNNQGMLSNEFALRYTYSWGITNDSFGTPLGSGLAILIGAGAGYAIVRRKRSRKNTMLLLACVALLGFTQCKKDQPQPQGETVRITLNVDQSNTDSKVNVNTVTGQVTFQSGDVIHVAYNQAYIGTLTHNGTNFEGDLTITQSGDQPLYFYYFGNISPTIDNTNKTLTVDINDQRNKLPVISCAPSTENYRSDLFTYSAKLQNKCALVKFTPNSIDGNIRMTGLKDRIRFYLSNNSCSSWINVGAIDLYKVSNTESWAILLPQSATNDATAQAVGYKKKTGISIPKISADDFITGANAIEISLTPAPTKAFSTSNDNYIEFAPGNLQATTTDGWDSWTWSFKEHQYDEDLDDNNIGENYASRTSTSHFGWGTSGYNDKKPNYTDEELSHYAEGLINIDGTNYDWGKMVGILGGHNDWRTLTSDEWQWIMGRNSNVSTTPGTNCRFSSTVNGVENARYTLAQITMGSSTINGTIIFPDVYTAGTPEGVTWGTINAPVTTWVNTTCTEAGWEALQTAGCVFLPAAGRHEHTTTTINNVVVDVYKVFGVGSNCYYWTTTRYLTVPDDVTFAGALRIDPFAKNNNVSEPVMFINSKHHRVKGACVRLVRDVD